MVLEDVDVDELNTCENEKRTLAFTWNPFWNEDDDGSRTYYPSQITLCPWFFEWAVAKKRMVLFLYERTDTQALTSLAGMV